MWRVGELTALLQESIAPTPQGRSSHTLRNAHEHGISECMFVGNPAQPCSLYRAPTEAMQACIARLKDEPVRARHGSTVRSLAGIQAPGWPPVKRLVAVPFMATGHASTVR